MKGSWPKVRLLEIADLNPRSFTTPASDADQVSFIPMKAVEAETGRMSVDATRPWGEVKKGYTPFQDGDVIFAKITPCMENGKYALAKGLHGGRAAGSTEFHVFRPSARLEPAYLLNFLFSPEVRRVARMNMRGAAGQLRVPAIFFEYLEVPLPALPEQRRIVAEIEKQFARLEAGVAALRRVQTNLKRYRAAVLKAACEGKLVPTEAELTTKNAKDTKTKPASLSASSAFSVVEAPVFETGQQLLQRILAERRKTWTGRGKYEEPAAPDTASLPALPDGWTWARLEQLGFTFGGLTKNPKRTAFGKQLPYLRVANVYANELRLEDIERIGVDDSELEKLLVCTGDLLIVEGNGSKDQIGRLAIWDGSIDPCVHQNHVIKVRPIILALSKWILNWLLSPGGRHFVEMVASSTSGLYTLSVSKVGDLPIALPPLAEQTRIVAEVERRLSVVEELEAVVATSLQRATRLRQAILQRAFSGRLVSGDS